VESVNYLDAQPPLGPATVPTALTFGTVIAILALALFAFGFIVGALNGLAIADTKLVSPTSSFGSAQVTEITSGARAAPVSFHHDVFSVVSLLGALINGLKTALCIMPLLASYGIPTSIALIVQGPIWLVYAAGIISFVTNRRIE
jgi:hypothetical protein